MGEVIQSAAPIAVLVERIKHHTNEENEGGLLHGLKWFDCPEWRVDGSDDLPNLCIIDYVDAEANFAGAVEGAKANANTHIQPTATVLMMLAVERKHGLYSIPGEENLGLLNWITILRDVMELKKVGSGDIWEKDASLNGTCDRPFMTRVRDNVVRELSWSAGIEITLYPKALIRGTRRDLMSI